MKHTPGKWKDCQIGGFFYVIQVPQGLKAVDIASIADHPEAAFYAKLIAAAPELLEVVEKLHQVLGMIDDFPTATGEHPDIQNQVLDKAHAVIAKVKGEQLG